MSTIRQYNYGLAGQPMSAYDEFLGLGKEAKKRRKAKKEVRQKRREARLDKARLKNEERKADIERTRVETDLTKQMASPSAAPSASPQIIQAPATAPAQPQQAGFGGSKIMIVLGLLVVGGFVYQSMKGKKAGMALNTAPAV